MEWMPALVAAIGGAVTLVGLVLARRQDAAQATKTDAEAAKIITDAAAEAIKLSLDPLKAQVESQATRIESLERRIGETEGHRDVLAALVRRHIEWEDNGRPDPPGPPTADPEIRALLAALPDR